MSYINKSLLQHELRIDFAGVYDPISAPILISNTIGEIIFINDAGQKYNLPFRASQPESYTLAFLHQKNPTKWHKHYNIVLDTGETEFRGKIATLSKIVLEFDVQMRKIWLDDNELLITTLKDASEEALLKKNIEEQTTHFQTIFNSIPSIIFVKDLENKFIAYNKALADLANIKSDQIIGKSLFDVLEDSEMAEKSWRDDIEVIETGLPKRNIIAPFYWDKSRWFITDKIPYRDSTGKVIGIIGFSTDITERKNVEDALVRSEKKFRQLFDTSPDGLIISNLEGNFISANKAFLAMTGYSEAEIPNLNFRTITPPEVAPIEYDFITNSLNSGFEAKIFDKAYLNKDKSRIIPVRINCWIIRNSVGQPMQLGVYVKDISIEIRAGELEKSLLEKEKAELQRNLQHQTNQLNMKVTQLIEKNELANNIINQLNEIEANDELTRQRIKTIIFDLNNSISDNFWAEFEATFGQVNQSFYERLYETYPNISKNERKISAFLRMNLSTKDIANITHQSIRSIEMARSRLRKKLNLQRSQNISTFLSNF